MGIKIDFPDLGLLLERLCSVSWPRFFFPKCAKAIWDRKKIFGFWRNSGVSLKGQISRLPKEPCWLYDALIALQHHSPLTRRYHLTENLFSSRCLTSVNVRELVFSNLTSAADRQEKVIRCLLPYFISEAWQA